MLSNDFAHSHINSLLISFFFFKVTLAVLDRANFLEYYGNRSVSNRKLACQKMFKKINQVAYHATCHDDGEQDFLRAVPCPEGSVCLEEDVPDNVVKGTELIHF